MRKSKALWGCMLAVALLLAACGKPNAGSSGSGSMSGSGAASQTTAAWKTGLGIVMETEDEDRTGSIRLAAAAVLLDGDGKIADVELDELETTIGADGTGAVHLPTDYRTKRQKGGLPAGRGLFAEKGLGGTGGGLRGLPDRQDAGAGVPAETGQRWQGHGR